MISVILLTSAVVECCCRNPNWWSGMVRFSSNIGRNPLSVAVLNILLSLGTRLIGLYEPTSPSGLQGFEIMTCPTFHWDVKYPIQIMELRMYVRWTMHFLGISFNIFPVTRSYPGTFLELRFSCIVLDFLRDKNLIGCTIYSGSFSAFLISVSNSSFFLAFCLVSKTFLNALLKCSLFLFYFGCRSELRLLLVGCVMSVVSIVWLPSRVKSRC
jgi:hypothetical protein